MDQLKLEFIVVDSDHLTDGGLPMIDEYMLYRSDLAAGTKYQYGLQLRKFFDFLEKGGDPDLRSITPTMIAQYLSDMAARGNSGSFRHSAFVVIRNFFEWCVEVGYLRETPFTKAIKRPHIDNLVVQPVSLNHAKQLVQYAVSKCKPNGFRDAAIFRLLVNTGLRRAECVGINFDDVKWDTRKILINGKGGVQRFVYPSDQTMESIRIWLEHRPHCRSSALFVSTRPQFDRLRADGLNNIVAAYRQDLGIEERFSPHNFRHTFASEFVENGGNVLVLMELLGHKRIESTKIYAHVREKTKRKQAESAAPNI